VGAFLLARDWEVHALALDRDEVKPAVETIDGVEVVWRRVPYRAGSKISFFLAWLRWWAIVIRRIRGGRYAVVHACNVESAIPAVLARMLPGADHRVVFDVRDFWGMAGASAGKAVRAMMSVERWTAKHTDALLLSQGMLARTGRFLGHRVRARTLTVQVLNVPGEDLGAQQLPPVRDRLRINFTGYIAYARNAAAIIELAEALPDTVTVDVAGSFTRYEDVEERLSACPNVRIHGRLPYREAMALMAEAHLVTLLYDTGSEVAVVLSANKMFEAMMLGRPYVASRGGFPALVAEEYGLGFSVQYGSSVDLIQLVRDLLGRPARLEEAAAAAREAYVRDFTWPRQEENLQRLYAALLEPGSELTYEGHGWKRLIGTTFDVEPLTDRVRQS
jgi:glycosyltransferase involved in cell wall biosynthesis